MEGLSAEELQRIGAQVVALCQKESPQNKVQAAAVNDLIANHKVEFAKLLEKARGPRKEGT